MKKIQKQIFGCFGLGVVAAMTVTAAFIPLPEASAATNLTDTIHVRVVGDTPEISGITGITDGQIITDPEVTVGINYNDVDTVGFKLTYTNEDGTTTVYDPIFPEIDADFVDGSAENTMHLDENQFNIGGSHGYGDYVLTITATGEDGVPHETNIRFTYAPFEADASQNTTTGMIDVNATDINTDNIDHIDIYVDGEKVGELGPDGKYTFIPEDTTTAKDYHIQFAGVDADGNIIYMSGYNDMIVHFDPGLVPDTGVPDTGGLFRNLNISREDYLITGLIVFFIIGIVGFGVVARNRRNKR
ncbi:hypothetical protein IKF12_01700 [Candidatus Saccharibacteria bacterium]|nr:hypothetical protein [Candidatus Saccharibacteria bacterium]